MVLTGQLVFVFQMLTVLCTALFLSLLAYRAFMFLRLRAKQNNLLFDLDEEYLISIWTGKCAIFGTTLQLPYSTNRQVPDKATIDKVIPELGYVKGNVQWVSNRANTIKSYGTLEEHQMIVEYIRVNTSDKVDNHQTLVRQN